MKYHLLKSDGDVDRKYYFTVCDKKTNGICRDERQKKKSNIHDEIKGLQNRILNINE